MGEKRRERKRREHKKRRLEVIEATVPLFYQRGFKGVTVPEIARAVDFGVGTLYRIFPGGKEEIYQAMQEIVVEAFEREIQTAMTDGLCGEDIIRRYIRAAATVYEAYPRQMAMYVRDTAGVGLDLGSGLFAPLAQRYRACGAYVENAVAKEVEQDNFSPFPAGCVLMCIRSVINGFFMGLTPNDREMTIGQRVEFIEQFIFNGLLKQ